MTDTFADRLFRLWRAAGRFAPVGGVLLFAAAVWAQDVALNPATPPIPTDPAGPQLNQALESLNHGNGWAIAGVVVSLLTWALRHGVLNRLPWPAAVTWLHDHPAAGLATPFVLSAIGGIITTFASGTPFTWGALAMTTLKIGVTAVATFVGAKTVTESRDFGKEQAAKVDSLAKANAELLKP